MEKSVVIVLALCAGISGYVVRFNQLDLQPRFVPSVYLQRQKQVLELFKNVCENYTSNAYVGNVANELSITEILEGYSNNDITEKFTKLYETNSFLPIGEIFTEYKNDHLEELKVIYGMFYHANSFDDFYKVASWAKQTINCAIYVDALYGALLNRKDTTKMKIPPPYEILPNYFIRRDALAKAFLIMHNKDVTVSEVDGIHKEGNVYTVDANYTGDFFENNEESKLAYFREDVGLNTFYYFFLLRNVYWVDQINAHGTSTSEYMYYIIRQLNARYNLERITNGLDGIEESLKGSVAAGYDPMLMYSDGSYFTERVDDISAFNDLFSEAKLKIKTKIQAMVAVNKSDLLDAVVDVLKPYYCHYDVSGQNFINKERLPSALDHYLTSLRDPAYYLLVHQHLNMFNEALNVLEPYSHNQLYLSGVEIMNIEVKKLQTYFDYTEIDVTNFVADNEADDLIHVKIGQPRLNHKPFSILINVSSLVSQKALVKIFIGPQFKLSEINAKKDLLKQLDSFEYNLKVGSNNIIRKSEQINNIVNDLSSLKTLTKNVEDMEQGLESFSLNNIESVSGFPSRLVLPKGTVEGFPLQFYVIILPYITHADRMDVKLNSELFSFGYPFDRKIEDPKLFDLANTMFKDIVITHKGENKVYNYGGEGASKKWYTGGSGSYKPKDTTYDYQSKKETSEYDYKNKHYSGAFDYQSKKDKYEKKNYDFESKRDYKEKPHPEEVPLEVVPLDQFQDLEVIPITTPIRENIISTQIQHENSEEDQQLYSNQPKNLNRQFTPVLQSASPFKDSKFYIEKNQLKHSKNYKNKSHESDEQYFSGNPKEPETDFIRPNFSAKQEQNKENNIKTEKHVTFDTKETKLNYEPGDYKTSNSNKGTFYYDYPDQKLGNDKTTYKVVKKINVDNDRLCKNCQNTILPHDEVITWVGHHDINDDEKHIYF